MIRILVLPGYALFVVFPHPEAFLLLFGFALVTDFLDGFLARRLHAQSEWGARIDSWADALSWIAFTAGTPFLWPDIFRSVSPWIAAALVAFLIPGLYGLVKYHHLPGFHTWSAKISMAAMGVAVLLLFSGVTPLLFYIATGLLSLVCLEETLMVHWLPAPRSDLRTARQAWQIHKEA